MRKRLFLLLTAALSLSVASAQKVEMSRETLLNKLKGGWAGQTIGVVYGGPTEFQFKGTMIQDYTPIIWRDDYVNWYHKVFPGLYDDIYMDLTFVKVLEEYGLDAPVEKFAHAFANAEYPLWHANQAARYNILNGIMPPASGHWTNNTHADDIDFQIEADFAGLMSPGMVNTAVHYTDEIGHIMNYGDGWYGGVLVAAMYSLAYIYDDVEYVVNEALKCIPSQSKYYECMSDVIRWHKEYPNDWKQTWFECEKKWSSEVGCAEGTFISFNIDATLNSAYVLIGLLYGEGDFEKSIEISTRCGQDSDCNPSTIGGILGVMYGYDKIPAKFLKDLQNSEDVKFNFIDMSLNDTYALSMKHALELIERGGGKVTADGVTIKSQKPVAVRFEECFTGHFPTALQTIDKPIAEVGELTMKGIGFTLMHIMDGTTEDKSYVAEVEVTLDGQVVEIVKLPIDYNARRDDLYWAYNLEDKEHTLSFKWLNPVDGLNIVVKRMVEYSATPKDLDHPHAKVRE